MLNFDRSLEAGETLGVFASLPDEMLIKILKKLHPLTLTQFSLSNGYFNRLCKDEAVWKRNMEVYFPHASVNENYFLHFRRLVEKLHFIKRKHDLRDVSLDMLLKITAGDRPTIEYIQGLHDHPIAAKLKQLCCAVGHFEEFPEVIDDSLAMILSLGLPAVITRFCNEYAKDWDAPDLHGRLELAVITGNLSATILFARRLAALKFLNVYEYLLEIATEKNCLLTTLWAIKHVQGPVFENGIHERLIELSENNQYEIIDALCKHGYVDLVDILIGMSAAVENQHWQCVNVFISHLNIDVDNFNEYDGNWHIEYIIDLCKKSEHPEAKNCLKSLTFFKLAMKEAIEANPQEDLILSFASLGNLTGIKRSLGRDDNAENAEDESPREKKRPKCG